MKSIQWFFWGLLVFCSSGVPKANGQTVEDFKQKVQVEWNSLAAKLQTSRWDERIQIYKVNKGKDTTSLGPDNVMISRVAAKNTGWLAFNDRELQNGKEKKPGASLFIYNQSYTAQLKKPAGADGWLLADLQQNPEEVQKAFKGRENRCPWMWMQIVELRKALNDKELDFTRLEQLPGQQPGLNLVRAFFTCRCLYDGSVWDESKSDLIVKMSGYIDFDPTCFYRPVNYKYNYQAKMVDSDQEGHLGVSRGPPRHRPYSQTNDFPNRNQNHTARNHDFSVFQRDSYVLKC